jgi:phage terminase large subunit-like protein
VTVGDDVEPQHRGVLRRGEDGVGEQPAQHLTAALAERLRVVGDVVVAEHRQRGVQVVEARVDQRQADHRHPEQLLHLAVRGRVGAEPVAGEDALPDHEEVALALVGGHRARWPP